MDVTCNGVKKRLEEIRVSAIPFNRLWPGKQRDVSQSEKAYVLRIEDVAPVSIQVFYKKRITDVRIRPQSKHIACFPERNTVSFTLEKYGQYVLEANGEHGALHIFYDEPERFEQRGVTYRFENGEYHIGKLELNDNDKIYIASDATLYANIVAFGKKNIQIFGHGILNGSDEQRTQKNGDLGWDGETDFSPEKLHTIGCIKLFYCRNVRIEGIMITDSESYAAVFYACEQIKMDRVKVVGHWKYNNDGIDFMNCRNVCVTNSFIRSFDDSLCIKGISAFSDQDCENITVDRCIMWCGWGKTLEIGLATAAKNIRNITFSNCDLIHNQHRCISVSNGQFADISDVLYRNINIEYGYADTPCIQENDEQTYESNHDFLPQLILITDARRNWQGNVSSPEEQRSIKNIVFENINVISEQELPVSIVIHKENEYGVMKDILIKNIRVNQKEYQNINLLHSSSDGLCIEKNF